ncbi:MAG TPA: hypothetical protein VIV12_04355 [Streptosporangiaceae bacterium]
MTIVSHDEAISRLQADHGLLLARVNGLAAAQLAANYRLASGPLGDFCESLHDLIAHVLMWDEINLAVVTEAAAGRAHWSLDPRWETPGAGRMLNRGGVEAGRHLPASLLLHRLQAVRDALLAELARYCGPAWTQTGRARELAHGIGGLAQKVWTVPGQPAFWHAAIHLNQLPQETRSASQYVAPGEAEGSTIRS